MNCDEIRERLPALIDRELEPAELAEVEKHLAECPECRSEKSRQEKFTTSVKISLEGLRPSDRFIKRVIEKLPEGASPEAREAEAAAARKKGLVSLAVAVVVIVLALLAMLLAARHKAKQEKGGTPPAPEPARAAAPASPAAPAAPAAPVAPVAPVAPANNP